MSAPDTQDRGARVVVGVHGDDASSRDAVALGVRLARLLDERLVLSCVWVTSFGPLDPLGDDAVREAVEEELRTLRALVPDDVPASTELRTATSVLRGLQLAARERDAEVLVIGSHRPSEPEATGPAAVPHAPCPVAVAPRGYRDAPPVADVVVAWDGSEEARVALEHAADLARRTGGQLRVVAVFETGEGVRDRRWARGEATQRWLQGLREEVESSLEEARRLVGDDVAVRTELREGWPATEVAASARGAGLVVAGSRGYGRLRRLVLGSTAAELLRIAEVPVLVTPRGVGGPEDDEDA